MRNFGIYAALVVCGLILSARSSPVQAQTSAFVINSTSGSIDQVDLSTMQAQTRGGVAAAPSPRAFGFVPGTSQAYIANANANSVAVYDTSTRQIITTIPLAAQPHSLAVSGDGARVYVSLPAAAAVAVIVTASNTVEATVTVGSRPLGVAFSRDGNRLYVANSGGRSISVVETATRSVARTIALAVDPAFLAVTADDQFLLITSLSGTDLTVLNLLFGDVFRSIPLGAIARSVTIVPDGTRIHVPTSDGVVTIDAATFLPAGKMTDVGTPGAVAFNSNGTVGYVADTAGGRLVTFDPATLIKGSEVALSPGVSAVALPQPMVPQSGWWWNTSESGRGYSLEVSGWKILYSAYAYEAGGDPVWYLAYLSTSDGESYTGDLQQYGNGQTLNGAYQGARLIGTVSPMSLRFTSPLAGTATFFGRTMPVRRYDMVANGVASGRGNGMPQTGWWWSASEGGRGYFIETQGRNFFLTAYMYDSQGHAVWYFADGTVNAGNVAQAVLSVCRTGQPLADNSSYRQPACTTDQGAITVRFASGSTATLTLPNGTSVALIRYIF